LVIVEPEKDSLNNVVAECDPDKNPYPLCLSKLLYVECNNSLILMI